MTANTPDQQSNLEAAQSYIAAQNRRITARLQEMNACKEHIQVLRAENRADIRTRDNVARQHGIHVDELNQS